MSSVPIPGFRVGPVSVAPGLVLAPMSGVTDSPFRRLVKRCSGDAVGLVVSEFIQIEMLTRGNLRSAIRMAFDAGERPVAIQLYGADPELMAEAAMMVEDAGADLVDINCGCPAPKICKRGGGAGLLKDLPNLARLLDAVTKAVTIPVTVKARNGWSDDTKNHLETLRVVQDHGGQALTIHGRTRTQLYTGEADWSAVADCKRAATIPVLGSGDIMTAADARKRFVETGCDGVLVGRGAITNPWIFKQISDAWHGRPVVQPTWRETIDALAYYLGLLRETYPEKVAPARMRMMLARLLKGFSADPELRVRCLKLDSADAMLAHLEATAAAHGVLDRPRPGGDADDPTEAGPRTQAGDLSRAA